MATFGENLVAIREARGLSQIALADRLKIRQPSLWKLEHQHGLPNLATLLKLAVALECSIEGLVAGVDPNYDRVVAAIPHRVGTMAVAAPPADLAPIADFLGRLIPRVVTAPREWWPTIERIVTEAHTEAQQPDHPAAHAKRRKRS